MDVLIALFWSKYAELKSAVDVDDLPLIARLDRELDPLLEAIIARQTQDPDSIQMQFQLALDLLNEEADDRGCVRRNGHMLQTLVARYITPRTGAASLLLSDDADDNDLDEALLNSMTDRALVIAPEYQVLYCNPANAAHLGLSSAEMLGLAAEDLIGAQRFEDGFQESLDLCLTGKASTFTYAEIRNGATVVTCCRMTPCYFSPAAVIGALVVFQERGDRRRQRAA